MTPPRHRDSHVERLDQNVAPRCSRAEPRDSHVELRADLRRDGRATTSHSAWGGPCRDSLAGGGSSDTPPLLLVLSDQLPTNEES